MTSDRTPPATPDTRPTTPDILVVAPWLQGGGGQRALAGVLRRLPRDRVRLVVLFDDNRRWEPVQPLVGDLVFFDCPRSVSGIVRARLRLERYLREADAVYSLMRASHLVLGIGPVRRLRRMRMAASFHQLPSQDSASLRARAEDVFVRRASRAAGLVTAPSRRALSELQERAMAQAGALRYEANDSDALTEGAAPREGSARTLRLLFAGRLTPQKGLDRLPELLGASAVPIDLRIAGDGELLSLVGDLAASAPGPHAIAHIGHTSDLTAEIDAADAVVLPSRWELNPLVVWEAWARGRPVLASDIPVFRDLAREGPVLTFATPVDFADRVARLAGDATARSDHFLRARSAFERHRKEKRFIASHLLG